MIVRIIVFIILFGSSITQGVSQTFEDDSIFLTERYQSIIFISDSLLLLEQGSFPLLKDSTCIHNYQLLRPKTRIYYDLKTNKSEFRYQKTDSLLILNGYSQKSKSQSTSYEIPYDYNESGKLLLDFKNVMDIFPHLLYRKCNDSSALVFTASSAIIRKPWVSINMNSQLEISTNGDFLYSGYGNHYKTGKLDSLKLKVIDEYIALCPGGNQVLYFQTPNDASNTHLKITFSDGVFESNGSQYMQPIVLQQLQGFMQLLIDSLSFSIIQTDLGWIDSDSSNSIIWYGDSIISAKEVPRANMQWAGLVQHKIYVIAQNQMINGITYDYILFVDEAVPNSIRSNSSSSHPITNDKRLLKKTISNIERILQEK